MAEVVTHVPVVPRIVQREAQPDTTRETGTAAPTGQAACVRNREMALHDYIRPVSAADVDARDLWVARPKAHVGEQVYRLPASEALFC